MSATNFDTHAAYIAIVSTGLEAEQADAIIAAIQDSQINLATSADISDIRNDIKELQYKLINRGLIGLIALGGVLIAAMGLILKMAQ